MNTRRGFLLLFLVVMMAFWSTANVSAQAQNAIRIIFLHHSTGHNLIEGGRVREGLTGLGYAFFDHGYNGDGLRLPDGTWTGENFDIPGDNTDPDGLAAIFSQPLHDPPDNAFSHLMQYDVILFKSCFPTSNIADDEQLRNYQSYYRTIRDTTDQYPGKLFVVMTPPPQVPNSTNAGEGQRARAFANWLSSEDYLGGHPNLVTFNFFDLLAGEDHFLKAAYRVDAWDAHPNDLANQTIGPILVDFLHGAIQGYFGEGFEPGAPDDTNETGEEGSEPVTQEEIEQVDVGQITLENYEEREWQSDTRGVTATITCAQDPTTRYGGESSLWVKYSLGPDEYASCANFYDIPLDWSGQTGMGFYVHSDVIGQEITFLVFSGIVEDPVPFEVTFITSEASVEGWDYQAFPWNAFVKSGWYGEGGINVINPGQILSFVISLESVDGAQGQFWVDGLSPLGDEAQAVQDQALEREYAEEVPPSQPETKGLGRICPFSTLVLPLLTGLVWLLGGKRRPL